MVRTTVTALVSILALVGLGCGTPQSAMPQLAESSGTIRAAEEMGASDIPEAALHLKLAKDSLKRGRQLVQEDEHAKARRALERGELDAELAIATVRAHQARQNAERADAELQEISARLQEHQPQEGAK